MKSRLLLWGAFAVFVAAALILDRAPGALAFEGPNAAGKLAVWAAFAGFLGYTLYCSARESLFETIGKIGAFHWGRQIGLDLYVGLALFLGLIALSGAPIAVLLWAAPILLFGNLATLLYLALHYDEVIARLAG